MPAAARPTIRRFLPWWSLGGGVLLLIVSIVLIAGHRSLPRQFGAMDPAGPVAAASAVPPPGPSSPAASSPAPSFSPASPPEVDTPSASATRGGGATVRRLAPAGQIAPVTSGTVDRLSGSTPPSGSPTVAAGTPSVRPGAPASAAGLPERLYLPGASAPAIVHPVVSRDGVLAVPENPADVGWWAGGARPGDPIGTLVIDGHVDSATLGIGALGRLSQLKSGDRITLDTSTGARIAYRVSALRVFEKASGLPASLFDRSGPARLVLISCGGPFDQAAKSYLDNIAVVALPE